MAAARRARWFPVWLGFSMVAALTVFGVEEAGAVVPGENGKIAFVSDRDGNNEVYLMDADGSGLVNLTNHPADDRAPAWSPDGLRIAFVSNRDGNDEIYVMDADGTNVINLTGNPADDGEPTWSPDGRYIAFSSDGAEVPSGIFVIRTTGGGRFRLTQADTGLDAIEWADNASDGSPAWSPTGDRIAFVRTFNGPTPLATAALGYTIAPDGSGELIRLPAGAWTIAGIDWSSDGNTLALADVAAHWSHAEVTLVSPAGQVDVPTPGEASHMVNPAMAPDGVRMAAAVYDINRTPSDIQVMNLDGTDPVNLTDNAAWDSQPAWQPVNPIPIGLVESGSGKWFLRHPSGAVTTFFFGIPGDQSLMGDWDCDGTDSPGVYRPSNDAVYLRDSNTTGAADRWFYLDMGGMGVPLSGDWNGDGCDTLGVFRGGEISVGTTLPPSGGTFAADQSYWFGLPTDQPFAGDFDGDGKDTIGLFRGDLGVVYLNDGAPAGTVASTDRQFWFGQDRDVVFAGDWTGSGLDTVGCFRPAEAGKFFFRFVNTTGIADREYFNFFGQYEPNRPIRWSVVAGDFVPAPNS